MAMLKPESVQFLILHSTNTTPKQNLDAKAIDRLHRGEGKLSIGYHFVITRQGSIQEGRKLDQIGAHHRGLNDRSIGICLVGGRDNDGKPTSIFTPSQVTSLQVLLADLREQFTQAVLMDELPTTQTKGKPHYVETIHNPT